MRNLFSLIFILFVFNTAYAKPTTQVMFILDASGSMWGQVEGRDKITVAKESLLNSISEYSSNINMGLIVFGHNSKEKCVGSEIIMPLSHIDENKMLQKLQNINPKTEGSISHALIQAAKAMRSKDKKATVVLLSDGQKLYKTDPCLSAKILEEQGIDFRVYAIAFGADVKAQKQLKCIADITGGTYFNAQSVESLEDSLKKVSQQIQSLDEEPKNKNLRITASEEKNSRPVRAFHAIYKVVNGKMADSTTTECYSKATRACIRHLDKGLYRVITHYKGIKKEDMLLIESDNPVSLHVTLKETGRVEIIATKNRGRDVVDAVHTLYKIVNNKVAKKPTAKCLSNRQDSCLGRIATGEYLIKTTSNSITRENRLKVVKGRLNSINVDMGKSATIEIISRSQDRGLIVHHDIYRQNGEKIIASCDTKRASTCKKSLLAGRYRVVSSANGVEKKSHFKLRDGESSRLRVLFPSTHH